jgi:hypothetical protein
VAWESTTAFVKEAEDRAVLAEREAGEKVLNMEVESGIALASTRGKAKGITRRIALLDGMLAEARHAQDTIEMNFRGTSDMEADANYQREEDEGVCQEQDQDPTLPQTWGFELCQAIVGPMRVRAHPSKGLWIVVNLHTEKAKQFVVLWAAISSVAASVLERSPTEAFRVNVVDELFAEIQKQEE